MILVVLLWVGISFIQNWNWMKKTLFFCKLIICCVIFVLCIVDEKNNFFHPKQEMGWRKKGIVWKKRLMCCACMCD